MTQSKPRLSRRQSPPSKRRLIFSALSAVAVLSVISVLLTLFVVPLLSHNDTFTDYVYSLGPLGPAAFIVIEFIQSLIPVWSGQPFEVFGGALYGWWAIPLTLAGSLLAYAVAFLVVRHLGRPLARRLLGEPTLEQFNFLLNAHSGLPLLVCSLIPFFPDDLICFGGGLTKFSFWRYMSIIALSRPLMVMVNTALGIGLDQFNIAIIAAIIIVLTIAVFLFYTKRDLLYRKLRRLSESRR